LIGELGLLMTLLTENKEALLAKCPVCQNEVQASFGMILCPNCETPLFFDFDGNPQVGDAVSDPPSAEVESVQNLEINFADEEPAIGREVSERQEILNEEFDNSFKEEIQDIVYEPMPVNEIVEDDQSFDLNVGLTGFSRDVQSVVGEGKADLNLDDDRTQTIGQFLYDIQIVGIDGSKLRNELYEELKDPRWGWVAIELMEAINMGSLQIRGVNAVKASLLINRLKALPLDIKWKQNA
jgi:hypothetical protein